MVTDSGTIAGCAYVSTVYVQNGATVAPGDASSTYPVGCLKVKSALYAYAGSHVNLFIYKANNTATARSYFDVEGNLSIDGDINVSMRGYTPKEGDEIILWTANNFVGAPTEINLPDISSYGLAWDTSDLLKPTGILRVVNPDAIHHIDAGEWTHVQVYTTEADVEKRLSTYGRGTYLLRMSSGRKNETIKISVK